MAIAIPSKFDLHTDSIVIGHAEIVSVYRKGRLHWALPGSGYTTSKVFATTYAGRLNRMILRNMARLNTNML
jgi:hypothetical protein